MIKNNMKRKNSRGEITTHNRYSCGFRTTRLYCGEHEEFSTSGAFDI